METLELKARELFRNIDESLEGYKHYTKEETRENEDNFIQAIISKDGEYLKEYYPLIEESQIEEIEYLLK